MVSSYQFSEQFNLRVIVWAVATVIAHLTGSCGRLLGGLVAVAVELAPWLALVAVGAGLVAVIVTYPVIVVGGVIVVAFGWATYPRTAVRP